jgi:L-threonylcarbamoyladenylate synthase
MSASTRGIGPKHTRIIRVRGGRLSAGELSDCADVARRGGLLVFPTDTVYGLACNAFDPVAVKKIYALKGRRYTKALPLLLSDPAMAPLVVKSIGREALALMDAFWPGALTLVLEVTPLLAHATRGKATIAVRVPKYPLLQKLLSGVGLPLAVTSANLSGRGALTRGDEVVDLFEGKVDVIIDGGECPGGRESSVVDASRFPFSILREGALSKATLERTLGLA